MHKFLTVIVGAVLALAIATPAMAAPIETHPSATPGTFYPLITDGYLDTTSIDWTGPTETHLYVYDASDASLDGELNEAFGTHYTWNGRGGTNLNGDILPADLYQFCVVSVNDVVVLYTLDGETPVFDGNYCTPVRIDRIDTAENVTFHKAGARYYGHKGGCKLTPASQHKLDVVCGPNENENIKYRFDKPVLGAGQTITGQWCGVRYYRFAGNGDVTTTKLNEGRCIVGVDGPFNGRIRSVSRTYEVTTEL